MELNSFINELIKMNDKDALEIDRKIFFKNKIVRMIVEKYKFNCIKIYRLYNFSKYILKITNEKLQKNINNNKYSVTGISELVFNNLKIIKKEYEKYFYNLFLRYSNDRILYEELKEFIEILNDLNITNIDFVFLRKIDNEQYIEKKYGEELIKKGLVIIDENQSEEYRYKLNSKGKNFFENIYFDYTRKEKEVYSSLINIEKMSTLDTILEHKKYFSQVMNEIGKNKDLIKIARLQDNKFKYFFDEYYTLIEYAFAKYGENCEIKFCANETTFKIKYDGVIKTSEGEELIEVTNPFRNQAEKEGIKKLNRKGYGVFEIHSEEEALYTIKKKVKFAIEQKRDMDSYNSDINLVVMFDDFKGISFEKIADKDYLKKIFQNLEISNLNFKSVSVLVGRIESSSIKKEATIINIK